MNVLSWWLVSGVFAAALLSGQANATQSRTYVSGTGDDNGSCTASSPCKSFSAALAATTAGGEIYVLNSADYGPVTISQSVTIYSEGATGGILATSGTGITISAGAADVVTLRGLVIDGAKTGSVGIRFTSGQALNIQKTVVRNFVDDGVNFAGGGSLTVFDSTVVNNVLTGVMMNSAGNPATAVLARVTASGNGVGLLASGSGLNVVITDAVAASNNYGIGASGAVVMVRNSAISNNAVGIAADQLAVVRVGQSTVTGNGIGLQTSNSGQIVSFGNNNLAGNTTDGSTTTPATLQ
jgi:hypothetical protein